MKLLSIGAAALTLSGISVASETDYSSFDKDIQALVSGQLDHTGPHISGYLQTRYDNSGDRTVLADLNGNGVADPGEPINDLGGFSIPRARVAFKGERAGYGYKVQVDAAAGTSILRDAYIDIPVSNISARVGQAKAGISRGGLLSSSKLFFLDRSQIADLFDNRDRGIILGGDLDQISWALSLQNGADGVGDDMRIAGRVSFDFMGDGIGNVEGAYDGPSELTGTASLSIYDDGTINDGTGTLFEAHIASSEFSAGLEFLDADVGGVAGAPGTSLIMGDTSAFSLYGTYMLTPNEWEAGLRFQDMDDANDSSIIEVAVNRYIDGHGLKYTAQYQMVSSDVSAAESDTISFGLQLAF